MNASEAGGNVPCFDTNLSSFLFRCKLASITRATYLRNQNFEVSIKPASLPFKDQVTEQTGSILANLSH